MTQAIEIRKHSACEPREPAAWRGRLWAWLSGRRRPGIVPFEQRSHHLLRDIGLGEDPRASHLLGDHHLFRR